MTNFPFRFMGDNGSGFSMQDLRPGTQLHRLFHADAHDIRRFRKWNDIVAKVEENVVPAGIIRDQQIRYYTHYWPYFIHGPLALQQYQEDPNVKYIKAAMDSCAFKTCIAGVGGFVIGGAFGLFGASLADPFGGTSTETMTTRQVLRDMGRKTFSSAKSFAIFGMLIGGFECALESYRGKSGLSNAVYAGFIAGGLIGFRAGPQAALISGSGFALFSAAIETYLHSR